MDRQTVRDIITRFFNASELESLCFDLDISYEGLPGVTVADKARELVEYAERHDRRFDLLQSLYELRPHAFWEPVMKDALLADSKRHQLGQLDPEETIVFDPSQLPRTDRTGQLIQNTYQTMIEGFRTVNKRLDDSSDRQDTFNETLMQIANTVNENRVWLIMLSLAILAIVIILLFHL